MSGTTKSAVRITEGRGKALEVRQIFVCLPGDDERITRRNQAIPRDRVFPRLREPACIP